jgi:hypothetical protein
MRRFGFAFTNIVVAFAVGLVIATASAGQADLKTTDVRVVNSDIEPMPVAVQGVAQVNGTVSLSGIPYVNLSPGTAIFTRPAVPEVYQESWDGLIDFSNAKLTIPNGKLLVVEHITARVSLDPGESLNTLFVRTGDGFTVLLDAKRSTCSKYSVCYSSHQPIRIYAKESLLFQISLYDASGLSDPVLNADVSGYLLSLPTRVP